MKPTMKIVINTILTLLFLFSTTAFARFPDVYKALKYIDSSIEINTNSSQEDVKQAIPYILANNDFEQIIVRKNPDGSIVASQKGEQIAQALFGKNVPNPYVIVETAKHYVQQLLLDPVRRNQYNKMRIAYNEGVGLETRLRAIGSLPSLDLQIKMGLALSNEDAKRGQKLTKEAENWLMRLIKTDSDNMVRVAAIKAFEYSWGSNEEVKNVLLNIIVRKQDLVSPQLRMVSAEVLWIFRLNSDDITVLKGIVNNRQEQSDIRARIFHTIEIKSPPVAYRLYREITRENIFDTYLTTQGEQLNEPMDVKRFKRELLRVRGGGANLCHRAFSRQ